MFFFFDRLRQRTNRCNISPIFTRYSQGPRLWYDYFPIFRRRYNTSRIIYCCVVIFFDDFCGFNKVSDFKDSRTRPLLSGGGNTYLDGLGPNTFTRIRSDVQFYTLCVKIIKKKKKMVLARVCRSRQRRVAFALTFRTHRTRYIIDIYFILFTRIYII